MRLLLDTRVWLWWRSDPKKLGAKGRRLLEDPRQQVFFSAASALEISLKNMIDRVTITEPLRTYLPRALEEDGFEVLPVGLDHAARVSELPMHHSDPFDRLLVAQAQVERLTLVTADPQVCRYAVETVWAGRRAPKSSQKGAKQRKRSKAKGRARRSR